MVRCVVRRVCLLWRLESRCVYVVGDGVCFIMEYCTILALR